MPLSSEVGKTGTNFTLSLRSPREPLLHNAKCHHRQSRLSGCLRRHCDATLRQAGRQVALTFLLATSHLLQLLLSPSLPTRRATLDTLPPKSQYSLDATQRTATPHSLPPHFQPIYINYVSFFIIFNCKDIHFSYCSWNPKAGLLSTFLRFIFISSFANA